MIGKRDNLATALCPPAHLETLGIRKDQFSIYDLLMTSYVYDPKLEIEIDRLRERDKRTSIRRSKALEGIIFPEAADILDIGSGTGVLGFDLLTRIEHSSLVSIDLEPSVLLKARNSQPENLSSSYVTSDAFNLPFIDGTFGVVSCQYVLQHLTDPESALREMYRVSNECALAVIFEWDDGVNFVHPQPPEALAKVFNAKTRLINQRGGDRNIGRKLYHLLASTGWTDIEVKLIEDIWQGPEDRSVFLKGTELSLFELKPQLVGSGLITDCDYELAIEQLYEFYSGDVFSVVFFFAAFGRKHVTH